MTDEPEPATLVEFEQANGLRLGLIAQEIEGLVELDQGCCQIVTSSDVYRIKLGYEEARERIWPDRSPA